ncbi:MAG: DUF4838 domain-containing protein [Armatimonadetes bacterium]|nr:DUF4838 domain-containing protein [Armatimonadota bacterium]
MPRWVMVALMLVAAGGRGAAGELVLVEQGQARAQVVVPAEAPSAVRAAAEEFVRVLQQMTGASLPLVTEPESDPARPRVLIGACQAPEGLDADPAVIQGDAAYAGYVVACGRNVLALRGNTAVGTANAVYGFLQDQLGVRWFLPGELFTVVPRRRTVRVPEMRQVVTPSFVCRLGSASWDPLMRAWGERNRWDTGEGGWAIPYAAGFRHWMYALFPPSQYGQSHPDIYPLHNGKRVVPTSDTDQSWQPCVGNPETARLAITAINAYLDAHPEVHTYPFSINDNNNWCECDQCRALDVERPLYRGRRIYSDRWFTFVNTVARGVRAKHPDKRIGCFAYWGVELPPLQIERMEPNVFINLTQDTSQYFDPVYRKVDYDLIRAWQAKCDHVGKYDYYGLGALVPRFFPRLLAQDLKAIHRMGVRAFHSELYPYWANMGPMLYVASRLLWDVRLNPDRLLAEFYAAFGPAAEEMRAFYRVHEEAWRRQPRGQWFAGLGSAAEQMDLYTPQVVARAAAHLRRAEALATHGKARDRVRFIARGYAYPDLLLRGWTTARRLTGVKINTTAGARTAARETVRLQACLADEEQTWRQSIGAEPVVDQWYRDGGRPAIRSQWQAAVRAALTDAMRALSTWMETPAGQKDAALRPQLDRLRADPQVGLLWGALQGELRLGPNLLPNPGFEDAGANSLGPAGPDWQRAAVAAGWSTWQLDPAKGVFYLDEAVKRSGKASGAFRGGDDLCYITTVPLETGKRYLAEAWAYAPAAREGTAVALEVRWNDDQGRWFHGAADLRADVRQPGTWERLLVPFTAPHGAARAVILLSGSGIQAEEVVRFDDVFVGVVAE